MLPSYTYIKHLDLQLRIREDTFVDSHLNRADTLLDIHYHTVTYTGRFSFPEAKDLEFTKLIFTSCDSDNLCSSDIESDDDGLFISGLAFATGLDSCFITTGLVFAVGAGFDSGLALARAGIDTVDDDGSFTCSFGASPIILFSQSMLLSAFFDGAFHGSEGEATI